MKSFFILSLLAIGFVCGCSSEEKAEGLSDKTATSNVEVPVNTAPRATGNNAVQGAPGGAGGDGVGK